MKQLHEMHTEYAPISIIMKSNMLVFFCVFVYHTAGECNKTLQSTSPQQNIIDILSVLLKSRWFCLDSLSAEMSTATFVH